MYLLKEKNHDTFRVGYLSSKGNAIIFSALFEPEFSSTGVEDVLLGFGFHLYRKGEPTQSEVVSLKKIVNGVLNGVYGISIQDWMRLELKLEFNENNPSEITDQLKIKRLLKVDR